jgi:hypothetical protein
MAAHERRLHLYFYRHFLLSLKRLIVSLRRYENTAECVPLDASPSNAGIVSSSLPLHQAPDF